MKIILKFILKIYLKYLTKLVLGIHQPTIIAVAGSINKPFVKEEVKKVLTRQGRAVRANPKNFNTEIGLPLAVLGLSSGYSSFRAWWPIILEAPVNLIRSNFPGFLVLDLGTSDPGDMKYLLSIVRPRIAIITDITQRYREGFPSMDGLVREYEILARKLPPNGLLVINNDNSRIKEINNVVDCRKVSFGFTPGADWRVTNYNKSESGQALTIKTSDEEISICQNRYGRHHAKALLIGLIINKYVNEEKKSVQPSTP